MKHSKEEMLEKAKTVLQDLEKEYYKEENIGNISFDSKGVLIRGENKGKEHPCWSVSILEPVFDNLEFLIISDETGEPLYLQTKHAVHEIQKDDNGNYF